MSGLTAMRRPRSRPKVPAKRSRRYGVLLDGGHLTAVTVDGNQAVALEQIHMTSPAQALAAWMAKVKPREMVTVAVASDAEESGSVEIDRAVPDAKVRRAIEVEVDGRFRHDIGPFAIAAHVSAPTASPKRIARVVGVPRSTMADLWPLEQPNVRFTVPAMTVTVDGIHLVLLHSVAELICVAGSRVVETFVLDAGGAPASNTAGQPPTPAEGGYVQRVADEVRQVLADWARKQLPMSSRVLHVTGPGALLLGLVEQVRSRIGWEIDADPVNTAVDIRPLSAIDGNRSANAIHGGLAAAAAVATLDESGFLAAPGEAGPAQMTGRTRRKGSLAGGDVRVDAIKRAAAIIGACGVVAAVALTVVPMAIGHSDVGRATTSEQAAAAAVARLEPDIEVYVFDHRLAHAVTTPVKWNSLLSVIVGSAPQGVAIKTLKAVATGLSVAITAQATATTAGLVPQWLTALTAKGWGPQTSGVTIAANGTTTFTTTFTIPNGSKGF